MSDFTGHTPGPWVADLARLDRAVKTENGNRIICFCNSKVGDDIAMARANSRLIAAAPDLLAERDRFRRLLERVRYELYIIDESEGVAGFHLNGDIAAWDEGELPNLRDEIANALQEAGE